MKSIKAVSVAIVIVIGGGYLLLQSLTVNVPVGMLGVRIQQYGLFGGKGVAERDYGPGWHRDFGPIDTWVMYDGTVQTLEMTKDLMYGSKRGADDIKVQSSDGNSISIDVTVKYRIQPGKAHMLYQNTGAGRKYETVVRNEALSACMGRFGEMKTEDFYDPEQKRLRAQEVIDELRESLADNFIEVIDVMIRDVVFDPSYELKIRNKKLSDQEVELNKSLAEAERMRGLTQVIEAETVKKVNIIDKEKEAALIRMQAEADLEIAKITAEYKRYVTERQADADLIAAQKESEGTRLVKQAEADGEKLRNEAMEGAGGRVMVALEAAKNIKLSDVTISTMNVDLLDIDKMAAKLGIPETAVSK